MKSQALFAVSHVEMAFASLLYAVGYLQRVSAGATAAEMIDLYGIDASGLASYSAAYFYIYSVLQPLVGLLVDVFNVREVLLASALVSGAGGIISAASASWAAAEAGKAFFALIAGRVLIGIGSAAGYCSVVRVVFSDVYAFDLGRSGGKKFHVARYVGLLTGLCGAASLVGAYPSQIAVRALGLDGFFYTLTGVTLGLALAYYSISAALGCRKRSLGLGDAADRHLLREAEAMASADEERDTRPAGQSGEEMRPVSANSAGSAGSANGIEGTESAEGRHGPQGFGGVGVSAVAPVPAKIDQSVNGRRSRAHTSCGSYRIALAAELRFLFRSRASLDLLALMAFFFLFSGGNYTLSCTLGAQFIVASNAEITAAHAAALFSAQSIGLILTGLVTPVVLAHTRARTKPIQVVFSLLTGLDVAILFALQSGGPAWAFGLVYFLFGLFSGTVVIAGYTLCLYTFPRKYAGLALGLFNFAPAVGGAIFQQLAPLATIEGESGPVFTYNILFLTVQYLLSFALSFLIRERRDGWKSWEDVASQVASQVEIPRAREAPQKEEPARRVPGRLPSQEADVAEVVKA